MEKIQIPRTDLNVSTIALGCMRISSLNDEHLEALVCTALELGINFFDHADIYGGGECEKRFGHLLERKPELRRQMIIQSKCDIVTPDHQGPRYDTSKNYIIEQAKQSIANLHCGYLDVLLIHRPDPLMDPKEVAEAFNELKEDGLVHYFGVSNFPSSKIRMLQKYVSQPLIIDQIQLSAVHALAVDESVFFNMTDDHAISRTDQILDYAMENDIVLQAWCPLQASWEDGSFLDHPKYPELNEVLDQFAKKYGVTKSAVAAAWILRLPAAMQVIAGTTNPDHLRQLAAGANLKLNRQEWYDLYLACHHPLP